MTHGWTDVQTNKKPSDCSNPRLCFAMRVKNKVNVHLYNIN